MNSEHSSGVRFNLVPSDLAFELLQELDDRSRDVVMKRFSLDGKGAQTLEAIGSAYGITRERVRQIESAALKRLRMERNLDKLADVREVVSGVLGRNGRVVEERLLIGEALTSSLDTPENRYALVFFLHLRPDFSYVGDSTDFRKAWAMDVRYFDRARKANKFIQTLLEERGEPLDTDALVSLVMNSPQAHEALDRNAVLSYIQLNKHIHQNPFGEWGLVHWSDITPKGVRDKAYIVLRKFHKPLHFTEITSKINDAHFDDKQAYAQTVHNELIKDERFVLVGRGMYALREWGYRPGTVAEVLQHILGSADRPLNQDELVTQVLEQRFVKKNTIVLALQDKKRFMRVDKHTYTLAQL
jgi:hypothetical protein